MVLAEEVAAGTDARWRLEPMPATDSKASRSAGAENRLAARAAVR
jgi:hypothetical protein